MCRNCGSPHQDLISLCSRVNEYQSGLEISADQAPRRSSAEIMGCEKNRHTFHVGCTHLDSSQRLTARETIMKDHARSRYVSISLVNVPSTCSLSTFRKIQVLELLYSSAWALRASTMLFPAMYLCCDRVNRKVVLKDYIT